LNYCLDDLRLLLRVSCFNNLRFVSSEYTMTWINVICYTRLLVGFISTLNSLWLANQNLILIIKSISLWLDSTPNDILNNGSALNPDIFSNKGISIKIAFADYSLLGSVAIFSIELIGSCLHMVVIKFKNIFYLISSNDGIYNDISITKTWVLIIKELFHLNFFYFIKRSIIFIKII
jgi:hypothetical protein